MWQEYTSLASYILLVCGAILTQGKKSFGLYLLFNLLSFIIKAPINQVTIATQSTVV